MIYIFIIYLSILFLPTRLDTFDLPNSIIFAFIHDRDKRRIIEACSLTHFDTLI